MSAGDVGVTLCTFDFILSSSTTALLNYTFIEDRVEYTERHVPHIHIMYRAYHDYFTTVEEDDSHLMEHPEEHDVVFPIDDGMQSQSIIDIYQEFDRSLLADRPRREVVTFIEGKNRLRNGNEVLSVKFFNIEQTLN
jgi:hypothetical protein